MISNESRMKVDSFEINVSIKTLVYVYVYMQDETEAVFANDPREMHQRQKHASVSKPKRESQRHEE